MTDRSPAALFRAHIRKMQIEHRKTEALVWMVRLAAAAAAASILWVSLSPVILPQWAEHKFYSAACKLPAQELPHAILKSCAERAAAQ